MKPICEDIKDILVAAGGYTFGTNLFISKMPSNNLNVITLYDTSAANPDILLVGELSVNSFEIIICNVGYQAAYTAAEDIKTKLNGLANFAQGGTNYVIIKLINGPNEMPTHQLSNDDGKVYLSMNFEVKRY